MARLKSAGVSVVSLHGHEITLDRVISELGLPPLTDKQAQLIRDKLGTAIGQWIDDGGYRTADAKLDTRDIAHKLGLIALQLEGLNEALGPAFTSGLHHSHNIAVASQLVSALELHPTNQNRSTGRFLRNFAGHAKIVADAARVAAKIVSNDRGAPGRTRMRWHTAYREAIVHICEANGIRPSISTNRENGKRAGRFLQIAMSLQQVLPSEMRTRNEETLVTRLKNGKAQR